MSVWTVPSPTDFEQWEERLATGEEPSTAAQAVGFTVSRFRHADPERHAAALDMSREARGHYVDAQMEKWAHADDAPPPIRLAWSKRWNREYAERVEHAGELEVRTPDIADAVERLRALTAAAVRALTRSQPDGDTGAIQPGGAGRAGLPMGWVDRPS